MMPRTVMMSVVIFLSMMLSRFVTRPMIPLLAYPEPIYIHSMTQIYILQVVTSNNYYVHPS